MKKQLKIQKPISSSEASPDCLVYSQSRTDYFFLPFEACQSFFKADELKIYVEADVEDEKLTILKLLEPQEW